MVFHGKLPNFTMNQPGINSRMDLSGSLIVMPTNLLVLNSHFSFFQRKFHAIKCQYTNSLLTFLCPFIFRFDVDVPGNMVYKESSFTTPGCFHRLFSFSFLVYFVDVIFHALS